MCCRIDCDSRLGPLTSARSAHSLPKLILTFEIFIKRRLNANSYQDGKDYRIQVSRSMSRKAQIRVDMFHQNSEIINPEFHSLMSPLPLSTP